MTDKEAKAFYNSKPWKKKRLKILDRDHHECQDCIKRIKDANEKGILLDREDAHIRRGTEVHHLQELKEHPELALTDSNLITLCTVCHNIRHGRQTHIIPKKSVKITKEMW